jgi:hypothetical protein
MAQRLEYLKWEQNRPSWMWTGLHNMKLIPEMPNSSGLLIKPSFTRLEA